MAFPPPRGSAEGALAVVLLALILPMPAAAQSLRLRADAFAQGQSDAQAPTGLLVLQGQDKIRPWITAEALVWGGGKPDATGDVLVLMLRLRDPHGYGELRAGRFVVA